MWQQGWGRIPMDGQGGPGEPVLPQEPLACPPCSAPAFTEPCGQTRCCQLLPMRHPEHPLGSLVNKPRRQEEEGCESLSTIRLGRTGRACGPARAPWGAED